MIAFALKLVKPEAQLKDTKSGLAMIDSNGCYDNFGPWILIRK